MWQIFALINTVSMGKKIPIFSAKDIGKWKNVR
jgi:hypothetical protein